MKKINSRKRSKAVIVNRGFWPNSDVPGEALLALAEHLAIDYDTFVLTQSNRDVQLQCRNNGRGMSVGIRSCILLTDSSSKIPTRVIEGIYYALWVLFQLLRIRPNFVYVATDPPLVVPFLVSIHCKIFGTKYTYHLQDIHPEASNVVFPMPKILRGLLKWIDNITLRYATSIITLTPEMAEYIREVRGVTTPIFLLENASPYPTWDRQRVKNTMVFCGNAGRLQEIPLVISAIDQYLSQGGSLKFTFLGAGIHVNEIKKLSSKWDNVVYLGYLPAEIAVEILSEHEWGLLPINSEILKFAFPSKSSAYAAAGCKILAICDRDSCLARWVNEGNKGVTSQPVIENVVKKLFEIERGECLSANAADEINRSDYSIETFAKIAKKLLTL